MTPPSRRRKTKETEEAKCKRKLRHTDYLSALLHARALGEREMVIYPCSVCHGLHLGHDKARYAAHCQREGRAKITALLRRIRMHERLIAERTMIVRRLRDQLEAILISYDPATDIS